LKNIPVLFAIILFGLSTAVANADPLTLKGSAIRADLLFNGDPVGTNLFGDPLDKIGSGKEFSYDDSVATYTANFNANGLTVRVNCDTGVSLKKCDAEPEFLMVFKDNLFVGATFTEVSDSLGALFGGDGNPKEFVVASGPPVPSKNSNIVFDITPVQPTPEPSSIVFLGTGLLGLAGTLRRRFHV
jgi:hypothetical protein